MITKKIRNEADYQDALEWVRTDASTFTENWVRKQNSIPDLEDFLDEYPMYDHPDLRHAAIKTINNVAYSIVKESVR